MKERQPALSSSLSSSATYACKTGTNTKKLYHIELTLYALMDSSFWFVAKTSDGLIVYTEVTGYNFNIKCTSCAELGFLP